MDTTQAILHLLEQARWSMNLQGISTALRRSEPEVASRLAELQAADRLTRDEHGYWRISAGEVARQVAAFLATREESSGEWPPVAEADVRELARLCGLLVDTKWSRDADGDSPIRVEVCDCTRQEFMPFQYPPHTLFEDPAAKDRAFHQARDVAQYNLALAFDRLQTLWRIERFARAARQQPPTLPTIPSGGDSDTGPGVADV